MNLLPESIMSNVDQSENLPQIVDANGNSTNKEDGNFDIVHKPVPTTVSRGRGRPPKNGICAVYREKRPEPPPRGRGRPPKRGKGRGRPRKRPRSDSSDNEITSIQANLVKSPKPRGRPKKPRLNDPVQVNTEEPRKRGRPPKNKLSKIPSDKPRGRPKVTSIQDTAQEVLSSTDDDEDIVGLEKEEEQSVISLMKIVKVEEKVQMSLEENDEFGYLEAGQRPKSDNDYLLSADEG